MNNYLNNKISQLPMLPGCYLMKDCNGKIIYVGKAKKLKNRVSSYFNKVNQYKTEQLVKNICDFDYVICSTEKEALILELNLIKEHRPFYNVLLKDDKQYPYIEITKENFSRLRVTRNVKKNKSKLFGPFPDASSAHETVRLLNRIFPIRKCQKLPKKPCLYFHINQCIAPCINEVSNDQYQEMIEQIMRFLKGDTNAILSELIVKRDFESAKLNFELAGEYQKLILDIGKVMEKQQINVSSSINRDVFGLAYTDDYIALQTLLIRDGKILSVNLDIYPIIGELVDIAETLILQFYEKNTLPKKIVVDKLLDAQLLEQVLKVEVGYAHKGSSLKQLQMANQNASEGLKHYLALNFKRIDEKSVLIELSKKLNIDVPYVIEVFDISNLQKSHQVSGMVVFENGLPNKKAYRKYKIKDINLNSDIERLQEVLYRRYFRLLTDNGNMPNLIIVDGGQTHVKYAKEILDKLSLKIDICGLGKDSKHETAFLVNSKLEKINLDRTTEVYKFLSRIQDEVHRYAIGFHKQQRSKSLFSSSLDQIELLGPKRKQQLLDHFQTFANIKKASLYELEQVVPRQVAKNIYEHFKKM